MSETPVIDAEWLQHLHQRGFRVVVPEPAIFWPAVMVPHALAQLVAAGDAAYQHEMLRLNDAGKQEEAGN